LSELRLSFGNVADTYHRARPPYSAELLDHAQRVLELGSSARVLDLAAGTGRLTAELRRRFANVVAVEPDERMRAVHGGALEGSAESIPLADASVDAVFVGEAFHWFDPSAAIVELARILRPRGGLALVGSHWWETEPPIPAAAHELLREPYERFRAQRRPPWEDAFTASPFEPLRRERVEEELTVDPDELLTLYSTTSSLAALPTEERASLLARARPLLAQTYRLPIKHQLIWTRLSS
jgi:SAM-dependent methyltransferase